MQCTHACFVCIMSRTSSSAGALGRRTWLRRASEGGLSIELARCRCQAVVRHPMFISPGQRQRLQLGLQVPPGASARHVQERCAQIHVRRGKSPAAGPRPAGRIIYCRYDSITRQRSLQLVNYVDVVYELLDGGISVPG